MPNLTAQQEFVLQLEKLSPHIWDSTEREARLSRLLGTGGAKAEQVSLHAFRINIQTDNPADFEANNIDGGTLPPGQSSLWNQFTFLPQTYCLSVGFTHLAQRLSGPKDVSNVDPVTKTISDVVEQAATVRDILLQTPGDGSLGTVSSVAGNVITLNNASGSTNAIDGRGAHLLKRNQRAQIQSATYVPRGSFKIIDCFNFLGGAQTLTVDAVPGGTIATDLVIMAGLPGGAPVGPNGLPFMISTTTNGNFLGLPKSLSYVVANGVNAGQSQESVPMYLISENQIKQRLGDKALQGLFWHMHPSRIQAYMELGWNLEYIPLNQGKASELDLLFRNFTINGRKVYDNIHGDQTRDDLVNKASWCMIKWGAETPYWLKSRTGNMFFTGYDSVTGLPTTNETAYQQEAYQWGCGNPSSQGGIFNAKLPVGN